MAKKPETDAGDPAAMRIGEWAAGQLGADLEAPQVETGAGVDSVAGGDDPAGLSILDEPVLDPDAELAPLPTEEEMADQALMPDAELLRRLIASIGSRNVNHLRPALWNELQQLGARQTGAHFVLAGVSCFAPGEIGTTLTNWANAARRRLQIMADAPPDAPVAAEVQGGEASDRGARNA